MVRRGTTGPAEAQLQDEAALLAAAQRGDRHALGVLLSRERETALRIARAIVRNPQWAEDVVQSADLRVARLLPSMDGLRSFSAWYRTIVTNLARNALRDRRRRVAYEAGVAAGRGGQAVQSPLEELERAEWLERSLSRLPAETRKAIELRYLAGHSYREISERLRWPEGTVVSRIRRGLERLRAQLAGAGLPVALPVLERWLRGLAARRAAQTRATRRGAEPKPPPAAAPAPGRRPPRVAALARLGGLLAALLLPLLLLLPRLEEEGSTGSEAAARGMRRTRTLAAATRGTPRGAHRFASGPARVQSGRPRQVAARAGARQQAASSSAVLAGRVVEEGSGEPIAGAAIHAHVFDFDTGQWHGDPAPVSTSDEDGRFSFPVPGGEREARAALQLLVRASGHEPIAGWMPLEHWSGTLELRLRPGPGRRVLGAVADARGHAVPGLAIELTLWLTGGWGSVDGVAFSRSSVTMRPYRLQARTDAEGRFELEGLPPGWIGLASLDPAWRVSEREWKLARCRVGAGTEPVTWRVAGRGEPIEPEVDACARLPVGSPGQPWPPVWVRARVALPEGEPVAYELRRPAGMDGTSGWAVVRDGTIEIYRWPANLARYALRLWCGQGALLDGDGREVFEVARGPRPNDLGPLAPAD